MDGPILLCGLGHVGTRVADLLLRLGEPVTVVTQGSRSEWLRAVSAGGARVRIGDARDESILEEEGLATARALVAATDADLTNLEIALDARRKRPDLPVVVRLFDQSLALELLGAFRLRAAAGMSALAAPAFVAAALGETVGGSFLVDGVPYQLRQALPGTPLAGRSPEELAKSGLAELPGVPGTLLGPRAAWSRLREGGLAPRRRPGSRLLKTPVLLARLARGAFRNSPAAVRLLAVSLLVLFAASVLVFSVGLRLSAVDAVYFTVSTVTTTGYGDINLHDATGALKLYGCLVMVLGSAAVATLTSMLTDFLVSARISELLGREELPAEGHVVVAGLGNLGFRVAEELQETGVPLVVLDKEGSRFLAAFGPPAGRVVGDARLPSTLERAGVPRARAVVAATGDDAVNLAIGLMARRQNPKARVVVRLFDPELARKVEGALNLDAAISASRVAAPTFAAAALWPGVLLGFVSEGRLTALLETAVEPAQEGLAPEEYQRATGLTVLLRRPEGAAAFEPAGSRPLTRGEKLVAQASRALAPPETSFGPRPAP